MEIALWIIGIVVALAVLFVAAELVIGRSKDDGDWWQ